MVGETLARPHHHLTGFNSAQPFPRAAREDVEKMLWTAADAVETILVEGVGAAMQKYNGSS